MIDNHKVLGIIGGMGPLATAYIFKKIVEKTEADFDNEHIHTIIDSCPMVPDRTVAILSGSNEPVKVIVDSAKRLENAGADLILLTCCTAHYFFDEIQAGLSTEIVNMLKETAQYTSEHGVKTVGLLATTGTINSKVFEKSFNEFGIQVITPSDCGQQIVMDVIYNQIKAGKRIDLTRILYEMNKMVQEGVEAFVLGCTELPIAFENYKGHYLIDPTEILVRVALTKLSYSIKDN